MANWTLMRLQRALRDRAEAVDALLFAPLVSPSRASYRSWLCDLYGFISPFERRFAFTQLDIWFIEQRIKSGRLSTDLLALGLAGDDYTRLARSPAIPELAHPLDGLGWLVAIDRLTLQFDGLRRRLQPVLPRELAVAGSFLNVYENDADKSWDVLGRMIEVWVTGEADVQRLTAAASGALDALESWFDATSVVVEAAKKKVCHQPAAPCVGLA